MAAANGCHPAVALERQHQAATAVLGRLAEGHDAFPVGRGVVGDGKDACGIAEIDADCGLLRQRSADRLQQGESEGAASGGVDDEIRRNRLARAVAVLVAHAGDRLSIWRRQHFLTRQRWRSVMLARLSTRRRTARSIVGRDAA